MMDGWMDGMMEGKIIMMMKKKEIDR